MATSNPPLIVTNDSMPPNGATRSPRLNADNVHLLCLASNINELKKKFPQSFTQLGTIIRSMDFFSDADLFLNYIFEINEKQIFMMVSATLAKETVPVIHDALQLNSIFVISDNPADSETWAKNWSKIKGVFKDIDAACKAVEQSLQRKQTFRSRLPTEPSQHLKIDQERPSSADDKRHDRHRRRSSSRKQSETDGKTRDATPSKSVKSHLEIKIGSPKNDSSPKSSRKDRMAFETTDPSTRNPQKIDSPSVERKYSPIIPFEDQMRSNSPLLNSNSPTSKKNFESNLEQLNTLIAATEEELQKTLHDRPSLFRSPIIDMSSIDQLQNTVKQTIEKHVTTEKDNSDLMNKMFADLKQALVDTIIQQQQPTLIKDLIKQSVADALSAQQKSALVPTTTTVGQTNHRKPVTLTVSREIKITANSQLTRTDAAFRQQRNAVVANKQLREAVKRLNFVKSIADLVVEIKKIGTNDLENAWLVFCWIAQNISYRPHCNNNAADTVFQNKQGVCRGFVSLFHECCNLLHIECTEVSGFAKQGFLKPGEELRNSPHAWNSIVLDHYTYLIDPTWGAGGRDYEKKIEDFYFLTSPEELIYTHYSNGYQLLMPEITREQFLSLPVMKSTYYHLGLTLLSPKQGFNETNENLFKISIQTPKHVDLFVQLKMGDIEYPRNLHTICQRDQTKPDIYNCFISPPLDGLYEISVFGKTGPENLYTEAIALRLRVSNIVNAFTFPLIYSTFTEQKCILIEPLQRLVYKNEEVLIHMIIPNANVVNIQNGDDHIVPYKDEYKHGVLKKKVRVQGDLRICARWDSNADLISILCVFTMF